MLTGRGFAMKRIDLYGEGLIAAQKECDRIAGDKKGRSDQVRKGAGECSSAIRTLIKEHYEERDAHNGMLER